MRALRNRDGLTLGSGLTIGLLLSYRPWIIFAAGVLVGMLIPSVRRLGSLAVHALSSWARLVYARRKGQLAKAEQGAWAQHDEVPF